MILRLAFVLWGCIFAAASLRDGVDRWIMATDLPQLLADTSVEVRDRNGDLLRAYTVDDGLWRLGAGPEKVDPQFIDMLIAYEDKRFYDHNGVDPRAALRAAWQAVRYGDIVSGGSTLTMQVARLMENSGTGSVSGKLRQVRLALALERTLTKSEILTLYLTHAPYGGNLEGIRAGTLAWFGKEPKRLTPAQSALLIALPQGPEHRRPDRNLTRAYETRDRVLDRLGRAGVLSDETVRSAKSESISPQKRNFPKLAPHLSDRLVAADLSQPRHDLTIDRSLQIAMETLAAKSVAAGVEGLSAAIMVADYSTGEILASVGSSGYSESARRAGFVDMTQAVRSPGSTLKPLVYAMGFDAGLIHPKTLINDRPVAFGTYAPQNFDGQFRGELRIEDALRQSLNIPVVLLVDQLGPAKLTAKMQQAGVTPRLNGGKAGLAVALGGVGVTLQELVQLYAIQARGGEFVELHTTPKETTNTHRVLNRAAAWQVSHILSGMPPPKGAAPHRLAYKTGTSYGHRDAWAIGYDGEHVIGVWMGRPDGTPVPGAFGGDLAAPVLFEAFQRLKPDLAPFPPPPPETLMLATANLPQPLKRFAARNAVFQLPDAPKVAFPPNGASLLGLDGGVTVKLRDGVPPFSILANNAPNRVKTYDREIFVSGLGKGASTITVIDAQGQSDHVQIWLD